MVKNRTQLKMIVRKLVNNLQKKDVKVDRLVLFGSYASGKMRRDSDIDIAVISSSFNQKNIIQRQEILGEAIYPIGETIEAIGYGLKEYQNPPDFSFLSEIIATGKMIYRG